MKETDGFTLMEVMVAVAIVAILGSLAVAGYSRLIESTRLTTAANDIKGDLELAKLTAIRRHATVLASFSEGTGDSGTYTLREEGGATFLSRTMPKGVVLSQTAPKNPIAFNTLGMASVTGQIQVKTDDNSKYKRITVSTAGSITLQRSSDGVSWEI